MKYRGVEVEEWLEREGPDERREQSQELNHGVECAEPGEHQQEF